MGFQHPLTRIASEEEKKYQCANHKKKIAKKNVSILLGYFVTLLLCSEF